MTRTAKETRRKTKAKDDQRRTMEGQTPCVIEPHTGKEATRDFSNRVQRRKEQRRKENGEERKVRHPASSWRAKSRRELSWRRQEGQTHKVSTRNTEKGGWWDDWFWCCVAMTSEINHLEMRKGMSILSPKSVVDPFIHLCLLWWLISQSVSFQFICPSAHSQSINQSINHPYWETLVEEEGEARGEDNVDETEPEEEEEEGGGEDDDDDDSDDDDDDDEWAAASRAHTSIAIFLIVWPPWSLPPPSAPQQYAPSPAPPCPLPPPSSAPPPPACVCVLAPAVPSWSWWSSSFAAIKKGTSLFPAFIAVNQSKQWIHSSRWGRDWQKRIRWTWWRWSWGEEVDADDEEDVRESMMRQRAGSWPAKTKREET